MAVALFVDDMPMLGTLFATIAAVVIILRIGDLCGFEVFYKKLEVALVLGLGNIAKNLLRALGIEVELCDAAPILGCDAHYQVGGRDV